MLKHALAGCLLMLAALTASARADETPELRFGIAATETSPARQQWEPLLADLAAAIGRPVRGLYAADEAGVIEAMRSGAVQVAWLGSSGALGAIDGANGESFAQAVPIRGEQGYYSVLVVKQDGGPPSSIDDLLKTPGRLTLRTGMPDALRDYLVPASHLWTERHIDIRKAFTPTTGGDPAANLLAVADGQADVAASDTTALRHLRETDPTAADKVRIVWQSPHIPSEALVWRQDLSPELRKQIRAFFLGYGKQGSPDEIAHAKALMEPLMVAGFAPVSDGELLPLRLAKLYAVRLKIDEDASLAPDRKRIKLLPIEHKLQYLDHLASGGRDEER